MSDERRQRVQRVRGGAMSVLALDPPTVTNPDGGLIETRKDVVK